MLYCHRNPVQLIALASVIHWAILIAPALHAQNYSKQPLESGSYPEGVLEPWRSSDVACAESGLLEKVLVKPGDQVKAGDLLAQLDMTLADVQLAIARAQADSKGRMQQVQAEANLAEKKVKAIQEARGKRYSTQSELDRAIAEWEIVQGRLQAEKNESQILVLQAERMAKLLEQRRILAPIDGVVEKIVKYPGEYVSPNAPEVVRIVDVSKLRASFFLQPHEIATLKVGSKIRIEIVGEGQRYAVLEHIAPFPDGGSGLIEVHVLVDNPAMKVFGSRCLLLMEPAAGLISGR